MADQLQNKDELWLIHGKYYDLSSYIEKHPGGSHMILLGKGKDCSELFESVHSCSKIDVHKMLKAYEVKLKEDSYNGLFNWNKDEFYSVLSERVKDYFQENKLSSKSSSRFWMWVIPIIGLWAFCFGVWVYTASIAFAIFSAFLGVSLGFSVFHSASHGGLSKNSYIKIDL